MLNILYKKDWVVYAKRPFGHASQVVEYLGRYTHKIAISNHRLENVDAKKVTFTYKDYRKGAQKQSMTLEGMEFIRRFALHILPKGLVRIRHYGILSSSSKRKTIPIIRAQLPARTTKPEDQRKARPYNPLICPCCKTETMKTIENLSRRGPPLRMKTIKPEGFMLPKGSRAKPCPKTKKSSEKKGYRRLNERKEEEQLNRTKRHRPEKSPICMQLPFARTHRSTKQTP